MRIATLSIGDELICGRVTDTNAGTIAALLIDHGLLVQRHYAVGDSEQDIIGALLDLSRTSDVIIVTGGLGPTADDLTAQAAARATGRRLVVNEAARAHLREMYGKLASLTVCRLNDKQEMIPAKTTLIPNPTGTACGFHLMHNGCFMFFLPGVPSEMLRMLNETVIGFIQERVTHKRSIRTAHFNVYGLSEPETDERLHGIARPELGLHLGTCVSFPWLRVTLRAESDSEEGTNALLQPAIAEVRSQLGDVIFSEGLLTLDEVLANLFRERGLTLALAESCTGGMIAQRITDQSGCSDYFKEGAVTYSNASKIRQLGVSSELLGDCGAVSTEVATAMAKGVRQVAGSDLGLAVTGIAGPDGGSEEKPVGTVFISLAAPDGCWTKRFRFGITRSEIRVKATWTALDWLRRYLLMKG